MSQTVMKDNKKAASSGYASSSGNLDLFNMKKPDGQIDFAKAFNGQPSKGNSTITNPSRTRTTKSGAGKFCTVLLYILLVVCILIGIGGIVLCILYFNTDSTTKGWKIGGIVMGVITVTIGVLLIVVSIFKSKHKQPWKQKKEKNFYYNRDLRTHGGEHSQLNMNNIGENDHQLNVENVDNNAAQNNNVKSMNNNSGMSTNNVKSLNNSYGTPTNNYRAVNNNGTLNNWGALNNNNAINYNNGAVNNNSRPQNDRTIHQSPLVNENNALQPVMYSLYDAPPRSIVLDPPSPPNPVVEPSQLRTGNIYPRPYQPSLQTPRQDLITFTQPTTQTPRQDLISFSAEDDEKANRNRGTFTAFDRPTNTYANLRASQSEITTYPKRNTTENVVVRRVPIPTTKVAAKQPSTKVVIVKVPNVAGQLVMQPRTETTNEQ